MAKLNQIIAIEKGIKSRVYGEVTELHKLSSKHELFNGFSKQYQKKDEDGEDLPPEKKRVQFQADDSLRRLSLLQTEILNTTARKDWTNCKAHADVKVGDKVILAKAPVTYLLFLEKHLTDMRTFITHLPTLDEAENWVKDPNSGLYKTATVSTHRTKKISKPIVLYPATDKHPAQTQLTTEDVIAGFWQQEKHSGALPTPRKRELLAKVEDLLLAVKEAREEANGIEEITAPDIGEAIFNYILEE